MFTAQSNVITSVQNGIAVTSQQFKQGQQIKFTTGVPRAVTTVVTPTRNVNGTVPTRLTPIVASRIVTHQPSAKSGTALARIAMRHPAPLPPPPTAQLTIVARKSIPPKPHLSIRRSTGGEKQHPTDCAMYLFPNSKKPKKLRFTELLCG